MPAPQYRKHISDLLDRGVEVVDLYPVFKEWADVHGEEEQLFSKDHHISPVGAKLIADTIADYLKKTTEGLEESLSVQQCEYMYYDNSASANNLSKIYVNYTEKDNNTIVWHQGEEVSEITIFGDCNLQSYQSLGAGIQANLVYNLRQPVNDKGRVLLFDDKREEINKMSLQMLNEIKKTKISIYVAFCSAGFVRTSQIAGNLGPYKKLFKRKDYKWANFELK